MRWPRAAVVLALLLLVPSVPAPAPGADVLGHLDEALRTTAAASDGRFVYVFGGMRIDHLIRDTITRVDPETGSVHVMNARLPVPREGASAAWLGDAAYVFGGHFNGTHLDTILRYDPASDTITTVQARLPTPRAYTAAAGIGGDAYIVGGLHSDAQANVREFLRGVVRYNATRDEVRFMNASLPQGRLGAAAATDGASVWVFGGQNATGANLDDVFRFDVAADRMTRLDARLPTPRSFVSAAWAQQEAYLYGGQEDPDAQGKQVFSDAILRFEPAAGTISTLGSVLPSPRGFTSAAWAQGGAVVSGGASVDLQNAVHFHDDVVRHHEDLAPEARFTVIATGLRVVADGANSTDDGVLTSWYWDWGDGLSSTGTLGTHTYAAPGARTVTLTVTDDAGRTGSAAWSIAVENAPPVAEFAAQQQRLRVDVDASAARDPDGSVASWAWEWGDGQSALGAAATHTYGQAGVYTVRLTVTDALGASAAATRTLNISAENLPPVARFDARAHGLEVSVDAAASQDVDGTLASYAWTWGDGHEGSGAQAAHAYAAPGTYQVRLTVADREAATGSVERSVVVTGTDTPPVARAAMRAEGMAVTGDGQASTDDGRIVAWAWAWGDGARGDGPTASHTYAKPGTYEVQLVVTDDAGNTGRALGNVTVPVGDQPPVAAIDARAEGLTVTLDGARSSDPDAGDRVRSWAWSWGDGSPDSAGPQARHSYARAGTYNVTLTVTDTRGVAAQATRTVEVHEASAGLPGETKPAPGAGPLALLALVGLVAWLARRGP